MKPLFIVNCLVLLVSACSYKHSEVFYWGEYESSIYQQQLNTKQYDPYQQIKLLEADIQRAQAAQSNLAPGFYAHLALLYSQVGKPTLAIESLQTEKKIYPESSELVDRLLQPMLKTEVSAENIEQNKAPK